MQTEKAVNQHVNGREQTGKALEKIPKVDVQNRATPDKLTVIQN